VDIQLVKFIHAGITYSAVGCREKRVWQKTDNMDLTSWDCFLLPLVANRPCTVVIHHQLPRTGHQLQSPIDVSHQCLMYRPTLKHQAGIS